MSARSIPLLMPAQLPPRRWLRGFGASLRSGLGRFGRVVWLALEAEGQHRSRRELLEIADRWQHSHPKLARELRAHVHGGSSF
ncbi:MAG: hypothetical protein ABIN37_00010 [Burkholderiaceae bacterium]